jgi:Cys-tRNA(Pro)/Cys-tRNA(Cys) deacylase
MGKSTRATRMLEAAGVPFTVHASAYDAGAGSIGLAAAEALGESPARVLKTLMANVDGKPVCVIIPSDREAAMKKVAAACKGKHAAMMTPPEVERVSGYKVGGISPFGQTRRPPMLIDEAALAEPYVFINGGQRGLQVRLAPADAVRVLRAAPAALVA